MKNIALFLLTLMILLTACGGGDTPASTPTLEPASVSQTESSPETTELVEVQLEPQAGDTGTHVDGSNIVYVPAGEFIMGVKDGVDNPEYTNSTDGYWIYATEVTNSQYALCVSLGQCTELDANINPDYASELNVALPVTGVHHEQAAGYCAWINGRLPTEAEWEKAARGTDAFIYPWGNDAPACDKSNFSDCQNFFPDNVIAREAGRSPYKLFDMAGNVFEWVQDWYDPEAYTKGISLNEHKVIRGGAFHSSAEDVRTFVRSFELPNVAREDLGFRCVLENEAVQNAAPMCEMGVVVAPGPQYEDCFYELDVTATYCANGKPYANVEINTNDGQYVGGFGALAPGECNLGDPAVCTGPELSSFEVKGTKKCVVPDMGITECPVGYEAQNNVCVLVGSNEPGVCPNGFNTDPDLGCCSVVIAPEPMCPPGYGYEAPHCTRYIQSTVKVNLPSCTITDKPKEEPEEPTCDPATGAGCASPTSDIRLKTDIVLIGTTENGLPWYTFRYIGGKTVYQGVMAQDVLKFMPEAIVFMSNGYMAVNYDMLGLTMERVR